MYTEILVFNLLSTIIWNSKNIYNNDELSALTPYTIPLHLIH